jgi:TolB-like protein
MQLIFEPFRIDAERFELHGPGGRVDVEPQALELLIHLIRHRDRLVTKDELHQTFWDGRFVSDAALSTLVKAARRAVGDDGRSQRVIETLHGRGFRFVAPVTEAQAAAAPAPAAGAEREGPAIAVLPFETFSDDPANEILADGVTEEITTGLARFRWFTVIARNSAYALRDQRTDLRRLAAELGVDYLLEGSLNRAGDRVRVHAQLIDGANGLHVWAERYDLEFDDLFGLLDRITTQVVGALQPPLLAAERRRAVRKAPSDRTAWMLFVEAQGLLLAPGREANAEARRLLEAALAREPGLARVEAGVAVTHLWDATYGWTADPAASVAAAYASASRAVAADGTEAWAWSALGGSKLVARDHDGALADLRQAVRLNPNSALANGTLTLALSFAGDWREALETAARTHRLSPSDGRAAIWLNGESLAHFFIGDHRAALESGRRVTTLRPDYPAGHRLVAASAAAMGNDAVARAAAARVMELMPGHRVEDVATALPFRSRAMAAPYLEALRRAGLPD